MKNLLLAFCVITIALLSLNCQKDIHISPLAPTPTATPSILPTPMGVLGDYSPQGYAQVFWAVDTSPYVKNYGFWDSSDGSSFSPVTTVSVGGDFITITDNPDGLTFNEYYYVIGNGTLPSGPHSRIVHAVSNLRTYNLTLSITKSTSPTLSITGGTVTGSVKRVWTVQDTSSQPKVYWKWGDEGAGNASVTYGFSGNGVTYAPALAALSSKTQYNLIVESFNSDYWCIDQSTQFFTTP